MNSRTPIVLVILIGFGCAPVPVPPRSPIEVGSILELTGRVAGAPVTCVSSRDLTNNRSIGGDRILFSTRGSLVYVNETVGGCPGLARGRALSTATRNGRLCDGDVVRVFDPLNGMGVGSCSLSAFIPYRTTPR